MATTPATLFLSRTTSIIYLSHPLSSPRPLKCTAKPPFPLRLTTLIARSTSLPSPAFVSFSDELLLNEREALALLEMNPELASTSLESLRRRISSLQSLGVVGFALHRTISKRPEILTSPETGAFLEFIRENLQGLKPDKLERLLVTAHLHLLSGLSVRVLTLLDHGIPREKLGHVLNSINLYKFLCEKTVDEIEEMALFLQRFGWPDLVLRRPPLLNLDLHDQLIPRVEFFIDLAGGDEEAVLFLVRKLPAILSYTVEHYQSHLDFWRSAGISDKQVLKMALVYPNIFSASRERKLRPRVEFLKQCRLNPEEMFKFLVKAPLFLSLSFEENLSKKLCFLVKLGYRHRTRELALALGAATRTSCENMQMVIGLFFSYGFSCEDLLAMSKKHPQVLQYNHSSLDKKIEFLVEGMEREVGELLAFPAFLGYKLDERIKHRYEVKKDIRGKGMSLNKLLSVSTRRFSMNKTHKSSVTMI